MITIQIKIRKKLTFVKNVGSAVLWISQKVPPFFGLTKSSAVLWIGQKDTPLLHKGIDM